MKKANARIGFMQGRLSPIIDGKIQCFPIDFWRQEYPLAQSADFQLMEWTLDAAGLFDNPFNTKSGQIEILELKNRYNLNVKSVTCDNFMQAPFFKNEGAVRIQQLDELRRVLLSSAGIGVNIVVIPLVDQSSISNQKQEDVFREGMLSLDTKMMREKNLRIAFETDYEPPKVIPLLEGLPKDVFGINYDIGNSASLGFSANEEFSAYGHRIIHVHVKDRALRGTTVPLGSGNANFELVFNELKRFNYSGDFILQTARAADNNHLEVLKKYRDFTKNEIERRWN